MKKKKPSNLKFYGIIALFILVVSIVELIKNLVIPKVNSHVFDQNYDSSAFLVLPVFSIAIVFLLAIPRKNW